MAKLDSLTNHILSNLNTRNMNANVSYKLSPKERKQVKANVKALQSPKLKGLNSLSKAVDKLCTDNQHYDKTHDPSGDANFQYDAKGNFMKNGVEFSERTADALALQESVNDLVTNATKYNPEKLDMAINEFHTEAHYDLGHDALMGDAYMFNQSYTLNRDVNRVEDNINKGLKNAKQYQNKYALNMNMPTLNKVLRSKNHNVTFNQLFNAINYTHGCHAYLDFNKKDINTNVNYHQNTDYHGWPMFGGYGGAHKVLFATIKMPNSSYDMINMLKPNQAILGRNNTEHIHNNSFPKANTNNTESASLLENKVHTLVKRFAETPLKKRDFKHFPDSRVLNTMTKSDKNRYNYMVQDLKAKHTKHQLQATAQHAIDDAYTATNQHNRKKLDKSLHTLYTYGTSDDSSNKFEYLPTFSDDVDDFEIYMDNTKEDDWHQIAKNLNKYMKPYASKNSKDAKTLTDKLHTQKVLAETKKYTKQLIDAKKHLRKLHASPVLKRHLSKEINHRRPTVKKVQALHHTKHSHQRKLNINRNPGLQR